MALELQADVAVGQRDSVLPKLGDGDGLASVDNYIPARQNLHAPYSRRQPIRSVGSAPSYSGPEFGRPRFLVGACSSWWPFHWTGDTCKLEPTWWAANLVDDNHRSLLHPSFRPTYCPFSTLPFIEILLAIPYFIYQLQASRLYPHVHENSCNILRTI